MVEPYALLSFGEVLWDLFPEGARFGGAPANFACHAAVSGGQVSICSAVGEDARGDEAVRELHGYGIDTSLVQKISGAATGAVEVSLDENGKPTFMINQPAAWDELTWTPELAARIEQVDAVYYGTLGQRGELARCTLLRVLDVAKARGIVRILDVNLRRPFFDDELITESVRRASVLKISDDELPIVLAASGISVPAGDEGKLRALLVHYDLQMVVMTRGADGVLVVTADEVVDQAGLPTKVIDTVGAGDSFTATLVMGLLRGDKLEQVAREACERAAFVCAQLGAVPDLSEISEARGG